MIIVRNNAFLFFINKLTEVLYSSAKFSILSILVSKNLNNLNLAKRFITNLVATFTFSGLYITSIDIIKVNAFIAIPIKINGIIPLNSFNIVVFNNTNIEQ